MGYRNGSFSGCLDLRISAKSTVGALRVPLFGQPLYVVWVNSCKILPLGAAHHTPALGKLAVVVGARPGKDPKRSTPGRIWPRSARIVEGNDEPTMGLR